MILGCGKGGGSREEPSRPFPFLQIKMGPHQKAHLIRQSRSACQTNLKKYPPFRLKDSEILHP